MADATGETNGAASGRLRPPHQARVPRCPDHLRRRPARLPRAGRRPRPDRDGRFGARRGAARQEHPAPAARACCGRRSTAGSPATKTSTMPSGSPAIRRCAPSSAARASTGRRPRPARWAASRPSGWRPRRTSRRSPTCPAPGSTGCTSAGRRTASSSTWTASVIGRWRAMASFIGR